MCYHVLSGNDTRDLPFAVFPDDVTALDLANAHQLVRTEAGGTYRERVCHNGEWTGSFVLDDINRGKVR